MCNVCLVRTVVTFVMRTRAWTSLGLLLAAYPLVQADSLAKAIEAARKEANVPGMSIAVVKDGEVVLVQGFGLRDVARRLPVGPRTAFCIGSSSKAFTAWLVQLAAHEGKLALSDSPRKHVPDFQLFDKAANERMTVEDLLCHRSGLPRTDIAWYSGKFDRKEILQLLAKCEPSAPFRGAWQYQNVMFMVAGMVAESALGKPYADLLEERIFSPLGMRESVSEFDAWSKIKDAAVGYSPSPKGTPNPVAQRKNLDAVAPAGSIVSNAEDMAQWVRFQLGRGELGGKRIVPAALVEDSWKSRMPMTPMVGMGYALGWMTSKWREKPLVEHGGNIDGHHALVSFLPEQNVGIAVMMNVSASSLSNTVRDLVFEHYTGIQSKKPETTAEGKPVEGRALEDGDLGEYKLALNNTVLKFSRDKDRIVLEQSGVKVPLKRVGDKVYETDMAGIPSAKFAFVPSEKDPKTTEVKLEQGPAKLTLAKLPPYQATLSVEDLLAKTVEARGGVEALRKLGNAEYVAAGRLINDGLVATSHRYLQGGNSMAELAEIRGLGKTVGLLHSFVSPSGGGSQDLSGSYTDGDPTEKAWQRYLADTLADAEPNRAYESVRIAREEKVGGRDCYIVLKKLRSGSAEIEVAIYKENFRMLRSKVGPSTILYQDYRQVEGVWIPFVEESTLSTGSKMRMELLMVKFGSQPPAWAFRRPVSG